MVDQIDYPDHYGGADNPYEAIKVIEAWGLGFHLGNTVKYISRAGKKMDMLEDLKKARWYLDRMIALLEGTDDGTAVSESRWGLGTTRPASVSDRPKASGTLPAPHAEICSCQECHPWASPYAE